MRVVCLTDTHISFEKVKVPDGDLLLHAGDHSRMGTVPEVSASANWLRRLPHRHKVILAGNHDFCLREAGTTGPEMFAGMTYLLDQAVEIDGLRIYGSPWTPEHGRGWAFQLPRGERSAQAWKAIPSGIHLLITHGPPAGRCDLTVRGEHAGCQDLLQRVAEVKPQLHFFGHIHEGYGHTRRDGTLFVNGCSCSLGYAYMQPPHVFDWDGRVFHPVKCWHPSQPLWEYLVDHNGPPMALEAGDLPAATELGHAFWLEQRSSGVSFTSVRDEQAHCEALVRRALSFGVRLQDYWYRLLNDNPWGTMAEVPHLAPPADQVSARKPLGE